ncbi:unnamed protein product, partial [Vitis vinifera]
MIVIDRVERRKIRPYSILFVSYDFLNFLMFLYLSNKIKKKKKKKRKHIKKKKYQY